jgi:hypothetical protein
MLLEKLDNLEGLRLAREDLHQVYPLNPSLWLRWLRDEVPLASTQEEREKVKNLFDSAVADYLCKHVLDSN